ncbi:MAG: TonB-dependent receptor [Herminiimonas sp.]|nr:TonB-dependent receptor [Herminiimonas sp.]
MEAGSLQTCNGSIKRLAVTAACCCVSLAHSQDNPAEALELPTIEVIGTSPLPGLGIPVRDMPANVQFVTSKDLERQRQGGITDFLEQNLTSVTVNAAQGNPFQPDVSFRGFTASPLLGVPQGLSVFQDGVRINEAFGDTVNWDLLPRSAIANIQLIPGSNPLYGLNTLGGALAVYTKSGSAYPGGSLQISGGSFGRRALEFEQGGKSGKLDYFVTGNLADDGGWAEHNASRIRQFFGKLGFQDRSTDLDLSLTAADNRLQGTQTLPLSFSDTPRQAYTYPDITTNKLLFLTAKGSHFINENLLVGGNLYYRKYRSGNVSSNVNADVGAPGVQGPGETGEGTATGNPPGTNSRSTVDQQTWGFGLQMTLSEQLAGHANQFVIGGSVDSGRGTFTQANQGATFNADRGAVGIGDYAPDVDAATRNRYYGLFVSDTLSLDKRWALTLSGRYNLARIDIRDQTGNAPRLDGSHSFSRFNPALGITSNPAAELTTYATYNEGMRAPTAMELTCADPADPCKLPNSFLSDPPLRKVVARTVEAGARGKAGETFSWSASVYRTVLDDDIQFISSGSATGNAGFFQNVGKTRRQGLELGVNRRWGSFGMSARYGWIDATYQSDFAENSPLNTSADASGAIQVKAGSRLPAIPRHSLKLRMEYEPKTLWQAGINLVVASSSFARGDENNQDARGKVPGYAVVNLDASIALQKGWDIFARVDNVLDRQYANFGLLGLNSFTGPNRSFDPANARSEQFRGYGTPRAIWIGSRFSWK